MKCALALFFFLGSLTVEGATIKRIKGRKAGLRLTPTELTSVETGRLYVLLHPKTGIAVAKVRVNTIFPGKGVVVLIEEQIGDINSRSSFKIEPMPGSPSTESLTETLEEKTERESLAIQAQDEVEYAAFMQTVEPTKTTQILTVPKKPAEFQPWETALLLGSRSTETIGYEAGKTPIYPFASLRAMYHFEAIPLGVGAHVKGLGIDKKNNVAAAGASVLARLPFGKWKAYLLLQHSISQLTFAQFQVEGTDTEETIIEPVTLIGRENAASVGFRYSFSWIDAGLEYEQSRQDYVQSVGLLTSGLALNFSLSI